MTTRVSTLLQEYLASLMTSVTTMSIFIENITNLKALQSYLRSHLIKLILHLWSFHMKDPLYITQGWSSSRKRHWLYRMSHNFVGDPWDRFV